MFKKLKKLFNAKKEQHKHNYNLTFDNVAIPEIHTHKSDKHQEDPPCQHPIQYDNVAIPEVHIGETHEEEPEPEREENITYENVAIPEIHIYRKKK